MKKMFCKEIVIILLALSWLAGPAVAEEERTGMSPKTFEQDHKADMQAVKAGKVFAMSGKIKAIDLQHNTAVIECPEGNHVFTVGGPLSPKADLKIGGKAGRLSDFNVGDRVTVKWKATEKGHLILMLKAE